MLNVDAFKRNIKCRARKEPHVFGLLEPEPLEEKKNRSRSRSKKIESRSRKKDAAPEPAPKTKDKKHKEIVHLLLSFSWNSKFLWLKTQLFYLFYISCSFTLVVCGENNISLNLTNIVKRRSRLFLSPWSRNRLKKYQEPEPIKNNPAPQPCKNVFYIRSCALICFNNINSKETHFWKLDNFLLSWFYGLSFV